jgi:hypothetical protein
VNKALLVAAVVLIAACFARAETKPEDDAPPVTDTRPVVKDPEAAAAVRAYDYAEVKAAAEYTRAVNAARAEMIAKLKLRMDALAKGGSLDAAIAVKELLAFMSPKPPAPAKKQVVTFLPPESVVGVWVETTGVRYVLGRDGWFVYADNQPGTWRLTADTMVMTWATKPGQPNVGRVDTYDRFEGDTLHGPKGLQITKAKQKR